MLPPYFVECGLTLYVYKQNYFKKLKLGKMCTENIITLLWSKRRIWDMIPDILLLFSRELYVYSWVEKFLSCIKVWYKGMLMSPYNHSSWCSKVYLLIKTWIFMPIKRGFIFLQMWHVWYKCGLKITNSREVSTGVGLSIFFNSSLDING